MTDGVLTRRAVLATTSMQAATQRHMSAAVPPASSSTARFVRTANELVTVADALATAPWVAVDSESNSMFVHREQVCLLQLNVGGALFVVDPLALGVTSKETVAGPSEKLAALRPGLARSDRPLWVHGGEYDAAVLHRDFGFTLGGLFDTQQAASLLGFQKTGYGSLVEQFCGVTLSKKYATYDWATRPIADEALAYAIDDVVYLPILATAMMQAVNDADIADEVDVQNAVVTDSRWTTTFDPTRMWRIKDIDELDDNSLRALAKLYVWRHEVAAILDHPAGRLVNDEVLKWLARHRPKSVAELAKAKLKTALVQAHGETLVDAIASAQHDPVPRRVLPQKPPPAVLAREARLKAWRTQEAERRQQQEGRSIPLLLVLPPRALDHLAQHGANNLDAVPQLGRRRREHYGEALRALCA
jgi:ribonuclease D